MDNNVEKFEVQKKKKRGHKRNSFNNRRQETRWNNVGVNTGNQFEALQHTEKIKKKELRD